MNRKNAIERGRGMIGYSLSKVCSSRFKMGYMRHLFKSFHGFFLLMVIHLLMTSAIPAQIVSIEQKNVTLQDFMDMITQKSNYRFIYTDDDVTHAKAKNLSIKNLDVEQVLSIYFQDQPLNYKIVDRNIIISPKNETSSNSVVTLGSPNVSLQSNVNGQVLFGNGEEASSGITITIKGTNRRFFTKSDGSFSVPAKVGDVLVFSSVGYRSHEVMVVSLSTVLNVVLQEAVIGLDDVVVTGYQEQEKRTITGSMSQLKAEDFKSMPIQSFDQAMQGRMAGVLVQGGSGVPGGPVKVEIRGQGSISAGTQPLYIVDGVEINAEDAATNITASNPLSFLNPDDIASIEVLKDAAAASIYGAQAANGVVLITTKGGKAGTTKFEAEYFSGITTPIQLLDVMNTQQYLSTRYQALANFNPSWSPERVRTELLSESMLPITMTDAEIAALPSYNWQNEAYRTETIIKLKSMKLGNLKTVG